MICLQKNYHVIDDVPTNFYCGNSFAIKDHTPLFTQTLLPAREDTDDLIITLYERSFSNAARPVIHRTILLLRAIADRKCPVQLSLRLRYAFGDRHDGGSIGTTDDHCNGAIGCHGAFRLQYGARGRPGRQIGRANGRTSSALKLAARRRARHRKVTDPVARKHGEHPEKCRPRRLALP